MNIPTHIIGFNDTDLDKARQEFLRKTNEQTMGCQFLTIDECRKGSFYIPLTWQRNSDIELTELAQVAHNKFVGQALGGAYVIQSELAAMGYNEEAIDDYWTSMLMIVQLEKEDTAQMSEAKQIVNTTTSK